MPKKTLLSLPEEQWSILGFAILAVHVPYNTGGAALGRDFLIDCGPNIITLRPQARVWHLSFKMF